MRRRNDDIRRVSAGVALAAGLAGWLVLALAGAARPDELGAEPDAATEEAARLLSNREPLGAADRVAAARALLSEERRTRIWENVSAAGDLAQSAVGGLSPRRALKGARHLFRQARGWFERSPAEDAALALLDAEVAAGSDDPELLREWEELRARDSERRFEDALRDAKRALRRGDTVRARHAAEGARRLEPTSIEIAALLGEIELAEIAPPRRARLIEPPAEDVQLAGALLAERYERALELENGADDSGLARSAALLLSGRRDEGLEQLRSVADSDDGAARVAQGWLDDPSIDPEGAFLREQRSFRVRRALGWLGGDDLERHGLETSTRALRSWGRSLTPFNLALSFPARILLGREAPSDGLREAAERYLVLSPQGVRADAARAWLSELPTAPSVAEAAAWDDGVLRLPRSSVAYAPVVARPLLLSQAALERASARSGDLVALLRPETPALVLAPDAPPGVAALALEPERALELLAGVESGFADGALRSASLDASSGSDAVRRLADSVRAGGRLVAYPVAPPRDSVVESFEQGLVGRAPEAGRARAVRVASERRGLSLHGDLLNGELPCPQDLMCVERHYPLTSAAFAELDADGELGVGATASFGRGSVSVGFSESGPSAGVTLPVMHWLGLGRWVPVGLDLGVSATGGSVGLRVIDDPRRPAPRPYAPALDERP